MAFFGGNNMKKQSGESETIIGPSVRMEGKMVAKGTVLIQGAVVGSVKTGEDVHVAEGATVKASIDALNVFLAGVVEGPIKARGRLELSANARVTGDVEAKTVSIDAGAVLNGRCVMAVDAAMNEEAKKTAKIARRAEQPAH